MKNMKVKKTLTAIGAIMVLGLASQVIAQSSGDPINDPSPGYNQFNAEMAAFCAIAPASQPFAGAVSEPQWDCTDPTRTYNANSGG